MILARLPAIARTTRGCPAFAYPVANSGAGRSEPRSTSQCVLFGLIEWRNRQNDKLRNAVSRSYGVVSRPGVEQDDHEFAAIAGVNDPGSIQDGHTVALGEAASGADEPHMMLWQVNCHTCCDFRAPARGKWYVVECMEVEAGIAYVRTRGRSRSWSKQFTA